MASDLKWRMGFGWGAVLLLIGSSLAAVLATGAAAWLGIGVGALGVAYTVYRYRKWNGRGWRQVHFRAMLAYAGIAGHEQAVARNSGKEFDVRGACLRLGILLCGDDNQSAVDAMLSDLNSQQGAFLAGLVERHDAQVLPSAPIELRRDVIARLRGIRFCPQLVIASVIENTYGEIEAARYAVALVMGDAD